MKRKTALAIAAAVVLVVAAVVTIVVLRNRGKASEATTFTQVVAAQRGNLTASLTLTGEVSPESRVELGFEVNKLPLTELNVTAGQLVKKGSVLARIDASSLDRAVAQAEADLATAEEELADAKAPATALERLKSELSVSQAEVALEAANSELQDLLDEGSSSGTDSAADAAAGLAEAKARLAELLSDDSTQKQIDRLAWQASIAEVEHGRLMADLNPNESTRDRELLAYNDMMDAKDSLEAAKARAELELLTARNRVAEAEATLAGLDTDISLALAKARNKVAQCEYDLARAKDSLTTLLAGPDAKVVQAAQARFDAAKADLDEAKAVLEDAVMVAPFDGTVVSVGAKVGDLVSAGADIVTLADLTSLQIKASVDETDITKLAAGLDASITFDSFPGRRFKGKVLEVPLQGTVNQNVVTYDVRLSLEPIEGVTLKSGMTANLSILVGQRSNVILVPAVAIRDGESGNVVVVETAAGGPSVELPVEVGLSDGTNTEVTSGLLEGDRVVVEYSSSSQQQQQMQFGRNGGFQQIIVAPGIKR